ncbi:uncharacterized protein LOC119274847 isoform X2 [Triticum dicoccoides]|uniref:uncharacterized protein LOC119274847 isoform X2 n=1 Tax=Triticum dicoccoides TaxID=85692 RepID=UPI00188F9836|nr:uncharacterized protein LOC119274847 isoform X2 [Triticum dicoccoides]
MRSERAAREKEKRPGVFPVTLVPSCRRRLLSSPRASSASSPPSSLSPHPHRQLLLSPCPSRLSPPARRQLRIWRKRRDAGFGGRGEMRDLEEEEEIRASRRWLDQCKLTSSSPTRPLTTFSTTTRCSSPPASISLSRVPIKFVDGRGDASAPCEDKAEDQHGCGRSDRGDGIASFLPPFHYFYDPDKAVRPGLEADGAKVAQSSEKSAGLQKLQCIADG